MDRVVHLAAVEQIEMGDAFTGECVRFREVEGECALCVLAECARHRHQPVSTDVFILVGDLFSCHRVAANAGWQWQWAAAIARHFEAVAVSPMLVEGSSRNEDR